jgi:DNA-binding NarL/FixJ family response regulator
MRVAIADDDVLFRAGLASLLAGAGFTVTASVGTAQELVDAVGRDPPDAAIVDIRMPPPKPRTASSTSTHSSTASAASPTAASSSTRTWCQSSLPSPAVNSRSSVSPRASATCSR